MVKLFTWNARGLGRRLKRRLLRDYLISHSIDIVGILETKKGSFTERTLNSLSSSFTKWIQLPSSGLSGGILVGFDESKFVVLNSWIGEFSISVHFQNKIDHFV